MVEFSLAFKNVIAHHEAFTLGFDGTMMVIACIILTVMHPGVALADAYQEAKFHGRSREETAKEEAGSDDGSDI